MKKSMSLLLALTLALSLIVPASAVFRDVPASSALAGEVRKAVDYGLMNGFSQDRFGYASSMTRIQFITVLGRMMHWSGDRPLTGAEAAAMGVDRAALARRNREYAAALDSAAARDVVDRDRAFRPDDAITRREMSEVLVRALGLKSAAALAEKQPGSLPFTDVQAGKGYITIAYDIGMTKGTTATTFSPNATATRAQAAAMLVRIYEKQTTEIDFIHGFYAISAYSQLSMAKGMDAVSAGWSRMTWDGSKAVLSTTSANGNEYCVPAGYSEVANALEGKLYLSVFMDASGGVAELLASPSGRQQAVQEIVNELTVSYKALGRNPYSGVTIDFEGLRRAQSSGFTAFIQDLSREVKAMGKGLYVCVSPMLTTGSWYDGYDLGRISASADKVILMAYDYDPHDLSRFVGTEYYKTAATAPIDQVYWSMRHGVQQVDRQKLVLGFSCKNTAWKLDKNGKLLSGTPVHPSNETVARRLSQADTKRGWSETYQQSWAVYTADDGSRFFLWYQDGRSIEAALQAAKLLGITQVSLWRLGNIPAYGNWSWRFR